MLHHNLLHQRCCLGSLPARKVRNNVLRKAASEPQPTGKVSPGSEYEALKGASNVISAADGFEVDLLSLWQVRSNATVLLWALGALFAL